MWADACIHVCSLWAQLWGEVLHFGTNTAPGLTFSPAWAAGAQGPWALCSQGARACPPPGQAEGLPLQEGNSGRFAGGCSIINACKVKLMVIIGEAQGCAILICQKGSLGFAACTHWETLGLESKCVFLVTKSKELKSYKRGALMETKGYCLRKYK